MKDFLVDTMNAMFAGAFFCGALLIGHSLITTAGPVVLVSAAVLFAVLVGVVCLR